MLPASASFRCFCASKSVLPELHTRHFCHLMKLMVQYQYQLLTCWCSTRIAAWLHLIPMLLCFQICSIVTSLSLWCPLQCHSSHPLPPLDLHSLKMALYLSSPLLEVLTVVLEVVYVSRGQKSDQFKLSLLLAPTMTLLSKVDSLWQNWQRNVETNCAALPFLGSNTNLLLRNFSIHSTYPTPRIPYSYYYYYSYYSYYYYVTKSVKWRYHGNQAW